MKTTWYRDPDESDCPDTPYVVRLHQGEDAIELCRCRDENRARVTCSALNSVLQDDAVAKFQALDSLFGERIVAPDEIVGFHPLTQTV
ncbi:MAG: hypothetical protein NXI14_09150 [bacterium]|nr:hypothetical protein [bacterium]